MALLSFEEAQRLLEGRSSIGNGTAGANSAELSTDEIARIRQAVADLTYDSASEQTNLPWYEEPGAWFNRLPEDNPIKPIVRNTATLGSGAITGAARIPAGIGYGVGVVDRALGDGQNSFEDFTSSMLSDADKLAQDINYQATQGTGQQNLVQQTLGAVGSSIPSLLVSLGLGGLAGAGGNIAKLVSAPSITYNVLSDAAGEAASVKNELLAKGANLDEANRQADYTGLYNLGANAIIDTAGGALTRGANRIANPVLRMLGVMGSEGLQEAVQEPLQDVASGAAANLSPDGTPLAPMEYLSNLGNAMVNDAPRAFAETSLPSFLSSVITGGAMSGADISMEALQRALTRAPAEEAEALAPEVQAAREVERVASTPQTSLQNVVNARLNVEDAPVQGPPRRPQTSLQEAVNQLLGDRGVAGGDIAPQQPYATQQPVQAPEAIEAAVAPETAVERTQTPKEQALVWAETELRRLTEETQGEYDEEGNLLNPMSEQDAVRYAQIARARASGDTQALQALQSVSSHTPRTSQVPQTSQVEDTRRFDMMIGPNAQGIDREKYDAFMSGASTEETGWQRGSDGKAKFEVPDVIDHVSIPAVSKGKRKNAKLGELFPDIVQYYPELANRQVVLLNNEGLDFDGENIPGPKGYLKLNMAKGEREAKFTLLHEVQHAIQDIEGFAPGTSPEEMEELKSELTTPQLIKINEEINSLEQAQTPKTDPRLRSLYAKRNRIVDQFQRSDGLNLYKDSAGEMEAFETELRADMTEDELRANPRVMRDDAILHARDAGYKDNAQAPTLGSIIKNAAKRVFGSNGTGLEMDENTARVLDMRAFTGSPRKFKTKMSTKYIGSGQGAAVHGWGLYFSSKALVSERMYRRKYSRPTGVESINGQPLTEEQSNLINKYVQFDLEAMRKNDRLKKTDSEFVKSQIRNSIKDMTPQEQIAAASLLNAKGKFTLAEGGQLYEVDIPDVSELINEHATPDEQPEGVMEKLRAFADSEASEEQNATPLFSLDGKAVSETDKNNDEYTQAIIKLYKKAQKRGTVTKKSFVSVVRADIEQTELDMALGDDSAAEHYAVLKRIASDLNSDNLSFDNLESETEAIKRPTLFLNGEPVFSKNRDSQTVKQNAALLVYDRALQDTNANYTEDTDDLLNALPKVVDKLEEQLEYLKSEDDYEESDDYNEIVEMLDFLDGFEYYIQDGKVFLPSADYGKYTGHGFINSEEARTVISDWLDSEEPGGDLMQALENAAVAYISNEDRPDEAASRVLMEAGIPGLVYKGETGSMSDNSPSVDNYVIWDDSTIETTRTFFQEAIAEADRQTARDTQSTDGVTITQPTDNVDAIFDDVVDQLSKAGAPEVETRIQARFYATAVENFGKMLGVDGSSLWKDLNVKFSVEDVAAATGRRGAFGGTTEVKGNLFKNSKIRVILDPKHSMFLTPFHEQGHFFTLMFEDAAKQFKDNAYIQSSWEALKKYGTVNGEMDYEKVANGFMNYAVKGEAPGSAELKSVFDKFKAWLSEIWSALTDSERSEFTPEVKAIFDNLLATDAGFNATYSQDNQRVNNLASNPLSRNKKQETRTVTNGNVTQVSKILDRSDTVNPLRWINSPSIIAEKYKKFAPVYEMGVSARREQDRLRNQYNHAIDKVFGKPGLFGRSGGLAQSEADRAGVFDALITGDMFGKELTDQDLKDMGISENAITGYKRIRNIYKNLGSKVNQQRNRYGKEDMNIREGYVSHIFHSFRVHDTDGTIINSFKTMNEAVRYAKSIAKDDRKITVRPVMQDFSGQAKIDAVTLGDMQYFKLLSKIENSFALSATDAKDFTSDVARMASKSRQFNNAKFRKGYAGYDMDMEYAVRHYANLSSRYIAMDTFKHEARKYFERGFGRFDRQYKGIAQYTKDYVNDVLGVPTAWEEAESKLVESSGLARFLPDRYQDRPSIALGQAITGVTATLKLGFMNIASALINLSSLNGTAALTGYANTTAAVKDYLTPNLEMAKLYRAIGLDTDISMESSSSYSKIASRANQIRALGGAVSSGLFSALDGSARKISAIAGYKKALKEGKTQKQAYEYARSVVDKTNFNYGVEDAPNLFRRTGATGNLLLQFKKYPIKFMELGINHLEGMEKVKFWAGTLVLSGLVGAIPGFQFINAAVRSLFDDKDIELEIKRAVADLPLPNAIKRQLLYGAFSHLGMDLGARMGPGDMLPSTPQQVLGPGLATVYDIVHNMPKLFDGWGGSIDMLASLSPGVANPMKAFYGQTEDMKTGRTRFKYDGARERISRATGFRPLREAVENDAIRIANYEGRELNKKQTDAIRDYLSDRSIANRDRLRALKVTPARLRKALADMKRGDTQLDRTMRASRRNKDKREALTGYTELDD